MPSLGGSGGRGFWRSPAAGSVDGELLLGSPRSRRDMENGKRERFKGAAVSGKLPGG